MGVGVGWRGQLGRLGNLCFKTCVPQVKTKVGGKRRMKNCCSGGVVGIRGLGMGFLFVKWLFRGINK